MSQILGKCLRLANLFSAKSGRMIGVMFDHTIARGVMPGLMPIQEKIDAAAKAFPNAMTLHKGIADRCFEKHAGKRISLILKCSSPSPYNPEYAALLSDVEEAVMRGADAIALGCILGGKEQARGLENAAKMVKEANKYGMPIVGHFYPNGEQIPVIEREHVKNVIYAARTAAELGIDVVKIHHSGRTDELAEIIQCVPAKVVIAGGVQGSNIRDYFQVARNIVDAGGAGIAFGRIVWSQEHPDIFLRAIMHIIHDNGTVDGAMKIYQENLH